MLLVGLSVYKQLESHSVKTVRQFGEATARVLPTPSSKTIWMEKLAQCLIPGFQGCWLRRVFPLAPCANVASDRVRGSADGPE